MSARHPIISIKGSSGAGTTTVTTTFQQIFRREGVRAAIVHGDAFHRYDRDGMRAQLAEAHNKSQMNFSHFGPEANLFEELEALFRVYGDSGTAKARRYGHRLWGCKSRRCERALKLWALIPIRVRRLLQGGLKRVRHVLRRASSRNQSPAKKTKREDVR